MEYRVNVGTGRYRHLIVEADSEEQARERFNEVSQSDYGKLYLTHGFTLKDVTVVKPNFPDQEGGRQ